MRSYFSKIRSELVYGWQRLMYYGPMILVILLSVATWYYSYVNGWVIAYNDAMSHLNLSRLVIDNMQVGLSQLGSVWLPLNHILSLPFIWNDWAWHSGFAGSIISMISYIVSVWATYRIIYELTAKKFAAAIGSFAFAANVNMLYLQTTPLTEPLYVAVIMLSALYFIHFIKSNDARYLLILGFLGAIQVMIRYDGWFVVAVEALLIIFHQIAVYKSNWKTIFGKVFLFGFPPFAAAAIWLLWNALIFGDPLYFAFGPYSARAQQAAIESRAGLITKGDFGTSVHFFNTDIVANIGVYLTILSLIGVVIFLFSRRFRAETLQKGLVVAFLLSPIIFNIIALYFGFSVLNLPELGWNPNPDSSGQWFNVRYGIMALPLAAVAIGFLAMWGRILASLLVVIIIGQNIILYRSGVVTLLDGTVGSSAFVNNDIAQALGDVEPGDRVLMSTSFFNAVAFRSGLKLSSIIHEGVSSKWALALTSPENHARWVVMANGSIGEPVYESLVSRQNSAFLAAYKLHSQGKHANIYRLKTNSERFIMKKNDELLLGSKTFLPRVVAIPDLMYKSRDQIDEAFNNAKEMRVNTVRFFASGEGIPHGTQPSSGIMNEDRLSNLDYIVLKAREMNLRLILVLLSNQAGYGGELQYIEWIGQKQSEDTFYAHPVARDLYKNYVNTLLSRRNSLSGVSYNEEPAILAWEFISDPRISGEVYEEWFANMLLFVRAHDSNHLIAAESDEKILFKETVEDAPKP